jgi:2-polyprenyl-3-methyl-5-hydroxy-6-metoxy-1,4-benzoquinol methylase
MHNQLERIMSHKLLSNFPEFEKIAEGLNSDLLEDFTTYYEESRFGLELILENLLQTSKEVQILEIGSGIGLLSMYLASQGFQVTSIEPSGTGFGMMSSLQEHVKKYFGPMETNYNFHRSTIEEYNLDIKYGFIFSINVFEHVKEPLQSLRKVNLLLEKGGFARIVCPNYAIPYEPHFNIPIFLSKKFTYLVFRSKVQSFKCFDPIGLWESLNWITITKVRKMLNSESILGTVTLRATYLYFGRLNEGNQFLTRKGPVFKFLATKTKFILRILPKRLYPILDLKIIKA